VGVGAYVGFVREGAESTPARLELPFAHRANMLSQLDEITHSLAAIDYKIATYRKGNS
jgi:hypothetical protein